MGLLLGLILVIIYMASGVSWFVHLWSQDLESAFSRKHYFIPWAFIQSQYHNPEGLNLRINRKSEQAFLTLFPFSTLHFTHIQTLFCYSD